MNDDTMLGRGATAAFATRKPCKHGSLICFECEPIKEPQMSRKYAHQALIGLIGVALCNSDNPDEQIGNPKSAELFANAVEALWDENNEGLTKEDLYHAFGHLSEVFEKLSDAVAEPAYK